MFTIDIMTITSSGIFKNQAIRYCIVGGMNTAVTAIVIITLTALGAGLYISNALGYVVGIIFSYALNTYFTFSSKPSLRKFAKFIACCAGCYTINIIAMNLSMKFGLQNEYLIQLIGMAFYTISGFFINKFWVMK